MLFNKSYKFILIFSMMLFATLTLSAWSITDNYFGNRFDSPDARSFSMGNAGSFNDLRPFGIASNPANLTLMKKRLGFQVNAFVNRNEDNRSVPLYNSFDNYIDDAVYASNINFFDNYSVAGLAVLPMGGFRLGVGGFYRPLLSFTGIYEEEIRNNRNTDNDTYPEKVAINMIENDGLLNQTAGVASFGMALGEYADLNFGVEYSLLSGEQLESKTIRWSQWAIDTAGAAILPNYTFTSDADLDGDRVKAGMSLRMNNRFGLAISAANKATLTREGSYRIQRDAFRNTAAIDTSIAIDEDYIIPTELRIGFQYQPRNIMRTWFNLDAEYVMWSDVCDHFEDQINLYAGVEHWVENRLPLRMGFQAVHNYLRYVESDGAIIAKKLITPMLSAGSSFPFTKTLTMDIGFAYSWREFEALDMFQDSYYNDKTYTGNSTYVLWPNQYITLQDRGWENPDKVRENNISFTAGLTYTW